MKDRIALPDKQMYAEDERRRIIENARVQCQPMDYMRHTQIQSERME